jgi:hypothetical protein
MAFRFVFNYEILTLSAGELGSAGLFGVEMIKARLARKYLAVLGKLQSLTI